MAIPNVPLSTSIVPGTTGHADLHNAVNGAMNYLAASIAANRFLGSPSAAPGLPDYRAITAADIAAAVAAGVSIYGNSISASGATVVNVRYSNPNGATNTAVEIQLNPSTVITRYASIQGVNEDGSNDIGLSFLTGAGASITEKLRVRYNGSLVVPKTITPVGTNGNQTINQAAGRVNIAAAGSTVTVTNNLVTVNSIVWSEIATNDLTARITSVVPANGSFVINIVACTAAVAINWMVIA